MLGDTVYYLISGRIVRKATVIGKRGERLILNYGVGSICLPSSRIYPSEEEAKKHIIIPPPAPLPQSPDLNTGFNEPPPVTGRYIAWTP